MEDRETMGQRIKRRRKELKLEREDVAARATELIKSVKPDDKGISESSVRDLERDQYFNPGFKAVEFVARALQMQPLELMAHGLSPEFAAADEEGTKQVQDRSRFNRLRKLYNETQSKRVRALVEDVLQMLIDRLEKG